MYLNQVLLIGRSANDVELKVAASGKKYARLSMAIDKKTKDLTTGEWQTKTDWVSINLWEKDAENASKYIHKGSWVMVDAQIGNRKREQKDGSMKYELELTAKRVQWIFDKISGDTQGNIPSAAEGAPWKSENKVNECDKDVPYNDEIPF